MAKVVRTTEEWVCIRDAAPMVALSVSGLRKAIARGEIKFKQTSKHAPIYLHRDWIADFNASTTRSNKSNVSESDTNQGEIDWGKL